jgi:sulfur-oxidizing protein SoxY
VRFMRTPPLFDRRAVVRAACVLAATGLLPGAASASPEAMTAAMQKALGGAAPKPGRIKLDITPLAENGNSVPVTITVDSPMTAADHVKSIYLFSPENPAPEVVRFHLGPRAGRARVQTSIRLATTQRIQAVAVMSDGSAWSDSAEVIVTLSACLDAG